MAGQRKPQPGIEFPAVLGGTEPGAGHDRRGTGTEYLPLFFRPRAGQLRCDRHQGVLVEGGAAAAQHSRLQPGIHRRAQLPGALQTLPDRGFVAATAFHFARAIFTDLVVGSSYTFIYGAFAAVPLFLLWIYLSWNIVLMGGILVHSMSAYQNEEQANRPLVLKALDVLHLFWQRQESGQSVGELELLNRKHAITRARQ